MPDLQLTTELLERATWEQRFTFAWDALLKMEQRAEDAERLLTQERNRRLDLERTRWKEEAASAA